MTHVWTWFPTCGLLFVWCVAIYYRAWFLLWPPWVFYASWCVLAVATVMVPDTVTGGHVAATRRRVCSRLRS